MEEINVTNLPIIPLRGLAVLPGEVMHCDIGRKKSLSAMEAALRGDALAFFTSQRDPKVSDITEGDMEMTGTVCRIRQVFRIQGDTVHLLVTGVARAKVVDILSDTPHFTANIRYLTETEPDPVTCEALRRRIGAGFTEHAKDKDRLTQEQRDTVLNTKGFSAFVDAVAQNVVGKLTDKQTLIEEPDAEQRALLLIRMIDDELEIGKVEKRIAEKVRGAVERNQKEFVLREQLKAVQDELGEGDDSESDAYRARMEKKALPATVREKLTKEIDRFDTLPRGSHEAPMAQSYIELMLDLPWLEESKDNLDLVNARAVLDRDHYGMAKVKSRIIESLAVQKLTNNPQGQILCLSGAPGVGKTSIARAVAEAMGRSFVRMSLGGVHDEAEIRGHRRTYIGAQPGRIIAAMRQAKYINPVLLFDEIDKLGSDMRGDPASAMLEVLDSAQNFAFVDHFLELPYDLSHCMLLTTANDVSAIPRPLLDRMEVIEVPSYLFDEKLEIAKRHLLPKQREKNGLTKSNLAVPDASIAALIDGYTREAGVRELDRVLSSVCRKAATEIVSGKKRVTANNRKLVEWLGPKKYDLDRQTKKRDIVGVVTGLAWTGVGGDTLEIEATAVPGKGSLQLTGQLGDVMQESAKAALTYVRANADRFGIESSAFEHLDMHIHVPEGAVPKDGPSAGVALMTALVSALSGIPVRHDVAMTGEITLRGRVLPIGGLREKLLAAVRAGMKTVLLPDENRESLYEVPDSVKKALTLRFVSEASEVLKYALTEQPAKAAPLIELADMEGAHGAVRH